MNTFQKEMAAIRESEDEKQRIQDEVRKRAKRIAQHRCRRKLIESLQHIPAKN